MPRPAIDDAELREVVACMNSGWLTSGPRVERFEQEMAKRAGRQHAVAVSNGTAALDLALRVAGMEYAHRDYPGMATCNSHGEAKVIDYLFYSSSLRARPSVGVVILAR